MQFTIPTKTGTILFTPSLPKEILKESLKIQIAGRLQYEQADFVTIALACAVYPKLMGKFTTTV